MKALIFNIGILCALCSITLQAHAASPKDIRKSFVVNPGVALELDVNFSSVSITTWSKNEMEVVVTITANGKTAKRNQEILDRITASVEESMDLVIVTTDIEKVNCGNSESFQVEVAIQMPATGSVRGKVEFGNLSITKLNGSFRVKTEYGNLTASELLSPMNDVQVQFGNAEIKTFGGGTMKIEYGNAEVKDVRGPGKLHSEFGNLSVGPINVKSGEVDIQAEFGEVSVDLSHGGDFLFQITSSFGEIDLPSYVQGKETKNDYTSKEIKGRVGSGGTGKVSVKSEFGSVKVK